MSSCNNGITGDSIDWLRLPAPVDMLGGRTRIRTEYKVIIRMKMMRLLTKS